MGITYAREDRIATITIDGRTGSPPRGRREQACLHSGRTVASLPVASGPPAELFHECPHKGPCKLIATGIDAGSRRRGV